MRRNSTCVQLFNFQLLAITFIRFVKQIIELILTNRLSHHLLSLLCKSNNKLFVNLLNSFYLSMG